MSSLFTFTGIFLKPLKSLAGSIETQPFENGVRDLVAYPQKRNLLRISARPPHLETPFEVFNHGAITPNDAFFVRYHLADIPLSIDPETFRLKIKGHVKTPLSFSLNELKALGPSVEVVAVNQCSGNSRGFSNPRVPGAQLGNGSMGNARWVGIPLKTVLNKAGVLPGAKQVSFNGLDKPVLPSTPDFIKAFDVDHALSDGPLIAWSMNGVDIPMLNGYPIKLIVPGYSGTYWVKHLNEIEVLDHTFEGFFMSTAYRLPDNSCDCIPPGTTPEETHPISRLKVRSFITNLQNHSRLKVSNPIQVKGIAFDSGTGIQKVELSTDGGDHWQTAQLGEDLGKYSFREWSLTFTPGRKGEMKLMVRATAVSGEVQPLEATWNPGGYMRNAVETVHLNIV